MGCEVDYQTSATTVLGRPLRGIDVDMNAISDTVQTLAVVALFAEGPTTIRNVAHIRHKETDRIGNLATELRKLGATVDELSDGLRITPAPLHGARIETYNDHRMAMSSGTCRTEDSRRGDPRPASIGKDISRILPRPGNARGGRRSKAQGDGYPWAGFEFQNQCFSHTPSRKRRNTGNRCLAPSLARQACVFWGKPLGLWKTPAQFKSHCVENSLFAETLTASTTAAGEPR